MITKEKYSKTIDFILRARETVSKIEELLDALGCRAYDFELFDEYESTIVNLLDDALEDPSEWTSYFLWERNGDLSKPCVYDADDREIDTSSWEKVYDMITEGRSHAS